MPAIPEATSRKSVTLPESMWKAIGEYRFNNRISAEAEAIRQLIQKGLDLPSHLDASNATVEILAGRVKHYPGPFSPTARGFDLIDILADEVQKNDPALSKAQAADKAQIIYRKAADEAGGDGDRARSLLNANWRRFA